MTIASTTSKLLYNGDGATTVFPISFTFWQPGDIRVIHRDAGGAEAEWAEGTHYTITGGGGGTGTLTVITAPIDHTPQTGEKLLIKSDIAELQQAALPLGGAFPSTTVEQMVDIVTRLIQQHSEEIARSVLLPETAALANLRLPEPGAGKVLRYNVGGTDLETVAFGDISTAIDTLLTGLADRDLLFWDAGQGAFVNGKTVSADLALDSGDGSAAAGPVLTLDRASASPAVSDVMGALRLSGRNDAAESVSYGEIDGQISDPADGSEDGIVRIRTITGGTVGDRLLVRQGAFTPQALGGDQGAGTVNAAAFHVHGSLLLPRGHIDGLILKNNGATPNVRLDIGPGEAVDDAQVALMVQAADPLVKRINASWAMGTNQGGLDGTESVPGTPDADTWYHVWLIRRSDTGAVDALFSESATAPTMPSAAWDQKRRIGAVGTDGSANIMAFFQCGNHFYWNIPRQDVSSTAQVTRTTFTVSVPTGLEILANVCFMGAFAPDGAALYSIVLSPNQPDIAPNSSNFDLATEGGSSHTGNAHKFVKTNSAAQLTHRENRSGTFRLMTLGWIDPRGENK